MKVIYDVGANNGDDIPYYLLKSDLVVSIEANPVLVEQIRQKYSDEIAAGRLAVESCVVTTRSDAKPVGFYVSKEAHHLSQFLVPDIDRESGFERITRPSRSLIEIIRQYGSPHYIKIDIERFDHLLLRHLFEEKIFPPYISCESHTVEVFSTLVASGGYRFFKLVDGATISANYENHIIATEKGPRLHSFPHHSAGPFGNDIAGSWSPSEVFFIFLANSGMGWKDIHATNIDVYLA